MDKGDITTEVSSTSRYTADDNKVSPYARAKICTCTEEDLAFLSIVHLLITPSTGRRCLEDHCSELFTVNGFLNLFADGKIFLPTKYLPPSCNSYTLLTVRRSSTVDNNLALTILFPDTDYRVSTRVDLAKLDSPAGIAVRINKFLSEYALMPQKKFVPRK